MMLRTMKVSVTNPNKWKLLDHTGAALPQSRGTLTWSDHASGWMVLHLMPPNVAFQLEVFLNMPSGCLMVCSKNKILAFTKLVLLTAQLGVGPTNSTGTSMLKMDGRIWLCYSSRMNPFRRQCWKPLLSKNILVTWFNMGFEKLLYI